MADGSVHLVRKVYVYFVIIDQFMTNFILYIYMYHYYILVIYLIYVSHISLLIINLI